MDNLPRGGKMQTTPEQRASVVKLSDVSSYDITQNQYRHVLHSLAPKLVADLEGVLSSNHELSREARLCQAERDAAITQVKKLEAEVKRLRTTLETYGEHTVLCKFEVTRKPSSCDCGLDAALAAQAEVKPCERCNGSGKYNCVNDTHECAYCGGSGKAAQPGVKNA